MLQVASPVEALENMGRSLEAELKSMLQFYGEKTDPPDARKPEDFFGLILSFSIALQVRIEYSLLSTCANWFR